jgi:hypothetical protein
LLFNLFLIGIVRNSQWRDAIIEKHLFPVLSSGNAEHW